MKLTERQKVSKIVRILEERLEGNIFLRDDTHKIGRIRIERKGFGSELGRPDAVVWIEIETHVLGILVSLKVPILVEAEEAGLYAAKEDFEKFFEREKLEIPMVVVGKEGALKKEKEYDDVLARVEVHLHQTGFDRIGEYS